MPSIKQIKRRIVSVKGTKQIIKAMNLVAASKLQKQKQMLDSVRPMFHDIQDIMDAVRNHEGSGDNIYFSEREVKTVAYVVISSDRGLCGGYNTNLAKKALKFMDDTGKSAVNEVIITAGSRGMLYLQRRGRTVAHNFPGPTETSTVGDSIRIGKILCDMYLSGEIDEAYVIYTKFKTVLTHIPDAVRILPISKEESESQTPKKHMIFDPGVHDFLDYAAPLYINTFINGALVEASVCEEASRMTSMEAADKNAVEIIDDLTLIFNRTRQGIITQEITEIVSGANALK